MGVTGCGLSGENAIPAVAVKLPLITNNNLSDNTITKHVA